VTEVVRYGVIGTGMMGIEHIENLNVLDGAAVTAIADPHGPSREAGAAAAEGPVKVFDSHDDLLADGGCDAYVVVTPNFTHAEIMADVMTSGKPILLEKPMCTEVSQCQDLVAAAAGYPSPIWVGLEYRYMAPVQRLLAELDTGVVGTTRMIAVREHRFPFLAKIDHWNRLSVNTGGTLVEKCCHYFDLMNLIAGSRATRVYASGSQDVNHLDEIYDGRRSDIIDNAFVIVDYESGIRASLDLCMFADATHNQEEISVVGDRGKLEALIPEDLVRIGRRGAHWIGQVEQVTVQSQAAHVGLHHGSSYIEHQRFLDVIRNGGEPEVTVEDGLWSVAVGVAAHRSIDEGRPIAVSEVLGPDAPV
jgi:predicted dehydrogenase